MSKKKYQIFVSSTFKDLQEERTAVFDAILSMRQFPAGMEMFGAWPKDQWNVIQTMLDETDYMVLILGFKYGTEIDEGEYKGISYTEREFLYAKEKGIPIIALLRDEASVGEKETDPHRLVKIEDFRKTVMDSHINVAFWTDANDLKFKAANGIRNAIDAIERPGWVRGSNNEGDDSEDEYEPDEHLSKEEKLREIANSVQYSYDGLILQEIVKDTEYPLEEARSLLQELVDTDVLNMDGDKFVYVDPEEPPDGHHVFRNDEGTVLREGEWKDGKLINGTEYNWIVQGEYKGGNDFDGKTEFYSQYESNYFQMSDMDSYIDGVGLDKFYITDIAVKMEWKNTPMCGGLKTFFMRKRISG